MGKIARSQPRVTSLTFSAVALGADNDILADTAMDEVETTSVTVFAGQPDVPRNVTVKGNDGNVAGDVVIDGLNAGGEAISETIALNGASVVVGNKAFASIDEITLPTWASANTERVRVGLGAKIGLGLKLTRNTVLAAYRAATREATAPTVAVSGSALESNTATLNSALNGTDIIIDLYETL